jgi:hypothetical protein
MRRTVIGSIVVAGTLAFVAVSVSLIGGSAPPVTVKTAVTSGAPGWLGSASANVAQNVPATVTVPASFSGANLLVALVATDGPDSVPVGNATSETTAVFGGTSGLTWTRQGHESSRQDWAATGDRLETYGGSATEVWTALPPQGWTPHGTVTEISNHPNLVDDGQVLTIAAFNNGRIGDVKTLDGLASRPEQQQMSVAAGSSVYAATFSGRVNANFTPVHAYHEVVQRRQGDDTAGVLASDSRDLPAGLQAVGYSAPNPGNYWEMTIAVITAAT